MRQHEVANGIRALDGVVVAIEGVEEPGIFGGDKVPRFLVGPELISAG